MDLLVQDPVLLVLASLPGTRTGRQQRELSLKTETDRIGELDPPSQKKTPWDGIMDPMVVVDHPVNGEVVEEEAEMENPAQEMVVMEVELDGDHPLQTSPLKAAVGDKILMGLSNHPEDLSGRMTALPWDGRICPFPILVPEDPPDQAAACHQAQG